jgi:hypothetical protein
MTRLASGGLSPPRISSTGIASRRRPARFDLVRRDSDNLDQKHPHQALPIVGSKEPVELVELLDRVERLARDGDPGLVEHQAGELVRLQRRPQRALRAEGMPEQPDRRSERVHHRQHVLELALDCIGGAVTAVAPSPTIHRHDGQAVPQKRTNRGEAARPVAGRAMDEQQ